MESDHSLTYSVQMYVCISVTVSFNYHCNTNVKYLETIAINFALLDYLITTYTVDYELCLRILLNSLIKAMFAVIKFYYIPN